MGENWKKIKEIWFRVVIDILVLFFGVIFIWGYVFEVFEFLVMGKIINYIFLKIFKEYEEKFYLKKVLRYIFFEEVKGYI